MSARNHIRSHRLFHDDVPSAPPPLPAKPEPWNLTPEEILHITHEPSARTRRYIEGPVAALGKISAHNWREYVKQQNAMDAPFKAIARDRFIANQPPSIGDQSLCESSDRARPACGTCHF